MRIPYSENKELLPESELNGVLIGMVLGDAHLAFLGENARIQIAHCPKQREYLEWKLRILLDNGFSCRLRHDYQYNKRVHKIYESYVMLSKVDDRLTKIWRLFYIDKKKVLHPGILNDLTPLGLAVWYMDDGHLNVKRKSSGGKISAVFVYLNTQSFTVAECGTVVQYFKETYDIDCRTHFDRDRPIIYFNTKNGRKLREIVAPHIVDCMKYKLSPTEKNYG